MSEGRSQRSEVRSQESGVRSQKSGIGTLGVWRVAVGCLMLVLTAALGQGEGWHVVAIDKQERLSLPIPVLARVKGDDDTGKTWQQTGTLPGALEVASHDFRLALQSGGWTLDKTIAVGQSAKRSELMIWTTRRHRVLLMIWEIEAGLCGFSWGEEKGNASGRAWEAK
jgi:hypothetical protein